MAGKAAEETIYVEKQFEYFRKEIIIDNPGALVVIYFAILNVDTSLHFLLYRWLTLEDILRSGDIQFHQAMIFADGQIRGLL